MDIVRDRLLAGEKLLWSGQPSQGLLLTARDGLLIPFSLMWGGFAVFWESSVWRANAPLGFRLWGVPFVLVGLYFVLGRFALDAWLRGRTWYAVTDRRILIARPGFLGRLVALDRDRLPEMSLEERPDGRGTIRFGTEVPIWGRGGFGGWTPSLDPVPRFLAIEDARAVFDRIQAAVPRRA